VWLASFSVKDGRATASLSFSLPLSRLGKRTTPDSAAAAPTSKGTSK
jgi:hypothetical protein